MVYFLEIVVPTLLLAEFIFFVGNLNWSLCPKLCSLKALKELIELSSSSRLLAAYSEYSILDLLA
jgi:hypothetical protein